MQYQVTIFDTNNVYRPVSTVIDWDKPFDRKAIMNKGIIKICQKHYWTKGNLAKYQQVKIREYDKEKIEAENKARYEAIKEAKYESGEWKRPKSKKER